jgi:hypothetical protein
MSNLTHGDMVNMLTIPNKAFVDAMVNTLKTVAICIGTVCTFIVVLLACN